MSAPPTISFRRYRNEDRGGGPLNQKGLQERDRDVTLLAGVFTLK